MAEPPVVNVKTLLSRFEAKPNDAAPSSSSGAPGTPSKSPGGAIKRRPQSMVGTSSSAITHAHHDDDVASPSAASPASPSPSGGSSGGASSLLSAGGSRKFIKVEFQSEQTFKTIVIAPETTAAEAINMLFQKVVKGFSKEEQAKLTGKYKGWVLSVPPSHRELNDTDLIMQYLQDPPPSSDTASKSGSGGGSAMPVLQFKPGPNATPGATAASSSSSGSSGSSASSGSSSGASSSSGSSSSGSFTISEPVFIKKDSGASTSAQQSTKVVEMLALQCNQLAADNERLRKKLERTRGRGGAKNKLQVDLNNIEVQEKLASIGGSMAAVYGVYVDGWLCAMKEIFIENPEDASAVENEINLVEDLPAHPNLVRYFFHHRSDRHLRLFMTKYAGTLSNFIEKRRAQNCGGFAPADLKRFILDIARGLQFLHSNKIIHRDLKAENIFVTINEHKEIARCAVGDFDTAKKLNKDTVARTCIGTPSFIAPEVLTARERAGDYNFKADVYSYGMIIYECLTLKQPYDGIPPLQISMKIVAGERPELPELPDDYQPFVDLHLRCTEMEPEDRPTVAAIIKELEALEV